MKDEMERACGTRLFATVAGGGEVCGTRLFAASAGDSKKTEYNGWKRRKRSCVYPSHRRACSDHVMSSVIFRFLRFHPLGAAIMPSGIACAPLYPKRQYADPVVTTAHIRRPHTVGASGSPPSASPFAKATAGQARAFPRGRGKIQPLPSGNVDNHRDSGHKLIEMEFRGVVSGTYIRKQEKNCS